MHKYLRLWALALAIALTPFCVVKAQNGFAFGQTSATGTYTYSVSSSVAAAPAGVPVNFTVQVDIISGAAPHDCSAVTIALPPATIIGSASVVATDAQNNNLGWSIGQNTNSSLKASRNSGVQYVAGTGSSITLHFTATFATAGAICLTPVATGNNGGAQDFVVVNDFVSNTTGCINVTPACTPASITAQPAAQSITYGANASFSVGASGSGTLSYQWSYNGNAINGENSSTLDLTAPSVAQSGNYTCTVSNACGSATSDAAALTVAKATAMVNVSGYTGTYDGQAHGASAGTATGVNNEDLSSLLDLGASFTDAPGGTANWSFAGNDNYNSASGSVQIAIGKANATVVVNGYAGTYDGQAHGASIGTATGVNGEDLGSLVDLGASYIDAPGGTANWSFAGNTNYNGTSGSAEIAISKANAVITITGYNGVYDGQAHMPTGTATGIGAADLSSGLSFGSQVNAPGGTVNWNFAGGTNYNDASGTASVDISKANATITVNGYTGTYDGQAHGASGTATGVNNEDLSSLLDLGATFTNVSGGIANWSFAGNSNYNGASGTAHITINPIVTTLTASVAPGAQQYSDLVSFSAKVANGALVGANTAAQGVTFLVGSQVMGTASLVANGNDLVANLTDVALVEGMNAGGNMAPGSRNVSVVFNNWSSNYANSSNNTATASLTINKENATVTVTSPGYFAVPANATAGTSVTMSLSATVKDAADGNNGNVKNARVTFRKDSPTGTVLGTANLPVAPVGDSTIGNVNTTFSYVLSSSDVTQGGNSFAIYAVLENSYYSGASEPTSLTVGVQGANFVTGGGHLVNSASAGQIAGTAGQKTNLGFTMQYNKAGTNLKGQCNIIVRSNGRIYQVKSNAVNTLVVGATTASGTPAYFNTKANYTDITDPLNPISMGGNMDLTVRMNDVSTGGQGDQVSILLQNPSTSAIVFSSNWNGATNLQTLAGGNVSVRTTGSAVTFRSSQGDGAKTRPVMVDGDDFAAKALGNPSTTAFTVLLSGTADSAVTMRVVDASGRLVEVREKISGETVRFGAGYRAGVYFVQFSNGNKVQQLQLVKQ